MRRYAKLLLLVMVIAVWPVVTGATTADRTYAAGKYGLELDGVFVGWLDSAEGGQASADVITEKMGPDQIAKKHIAGVKYEDITVTFGTGMSRQFYEWIKASFDHKYTRKNGAIITAQFNPKEYSRMEFHNALITEIGFPALDAASKDAAKMTIKFHPEYTRDIRGTVQWNAPKPPPQKQWLPANFRLKIDGLDDATSRVNKIEAIVLKQKNVEHAVGEMRDYEQEPGALEVPNLVFTTSDGSADALYQWFDDFVINGNSGDDQEKNGYLEFLSPDMKEVLFRLDFKHLGIFKLTPEKVEAGAESIRRVKAEMYCEAMSFSFGATQR